MSNFGTDYENGGVYRVEDILARVYDPSTGRLLVSLLGDSKYDSYESDTVLPGSSADGYDVKTTGGFFTDVTTATRIIIKNNSELSSITIYLNNDNLNPITMKANAQFDLDGFDVTNIFIDTDGTFGSSSIEITIFG